MGVLMQFRRCGQALRFALFLLFVTGMPAYVAAQIPVPEAYWSFDNENPATRQINDLTGNSRAGALFNGPLFSPNTPPPWAEDGV